MDTGIKILYYIIFTVEILVFNNVLFRDSTKKKSRYFIAGIIYILVITLVAVYEKEIIPPVAFFLYIVAFLLLLQNEIWRRLLHFVIVFLVAGSVEILLDAVLEKIPSYSQYVRQYDYPDIVIECVAALITFAIVSRKWFQHFVECCKVLRWFQRTAIAMIVLGGTALLVYGNLIARIDYRDGRSATFQWILLIFMLIILAGIIWFVYGTYDKDYYCRQNALKAKIIAAQYSYYQSIYENDIKMRKFKHDIQAQLGCLRLLLEEGNIQQAKEHLSQIESNYVQIKEKRIKTGNNILDLVINQAYLVAKEKGVTLQLKGKIEKGTHINTYDLCSIFSNAINNAIEACENIEELNKIIQIIIVEHNEALFFQISNPATKEMYRAITAHQTTKKNKREHGFGIENIRMAVEQNKGQMEYQYKNGLLTLEIYL